MDENSIPPPDTEGAACVWVEALNEIILHWLYIGKPDPQKATTAQGRLILSRIGIPEEERIRLVRKK
jgi:hypothetical protein